MKIGVEVTFTTELHEMPSGVSPGGAIFPFECLQSCNLEENKVFLRSDYEVWRRWGGDENLFLFKSPAPGRPEIYVGKELIKEIVEHKPK